MDTIRRQTAGIRQVIRQMIDVSDEELDEFLQQTFTKKFKRLEVVSRPGVIPNEIFFIEKGLIRVIVTARDGMEHTIHFALM